MPPTYEYLCPVHGVFEVFHSIKDSALTRCTQIVSHPREPARQCRRAIKRLISGGCGFEMDPDKCYDTLPPDGSGKVREAKTDLPKSRAKLLGIPREERKKYERLYY